MRLIGVIIFFTLIMGSCIWLLASYVSSIDTAASGKLLESSRNSHFFLDVRLPIPLLNFNTLFKTNN